MGAKSGFLRGAFKRMGCRGVYRGAGRAKQAQ
jgi:hypothetical protein